MLFLPWDLVIPYPELKWYNIVGTFRGKIYKIKDLQKIMAKKILIIEDDNFLRILLSKKLRSEVYSILSAAESVEAFNLLKSNKPDLILLDLLLPGVDGFEILKKIRQTEETKNIPVIVFSNLSEEKDIKKVQDLGITDFMVKSNFTLDELLDKVKKILQ